MNSAAWWTGKSSQDDTGETALIDSDSMEYRQLGRSGLTVSALGLGCNNFGMRIDHDLSVADVQQAVEEGITFFDTAELYGGGKSDEFLGAQPGQRREAVL